MFYDNTGRSIKLASAQAWFQYKYPTFILGLHHLSLIYILLTSRKLSRGSSGTEPWILFRMFSGLHLKSKTTNKLFGSVRKHFNFQWFVWYRPFHKTLLKSSEFITRISVSFMKRTVDDSTMLYIKTLIARCLRTGPDILNLRPFLQIRPGIDCTNVYKTTSSRFWPTCNKSILEKCAA